MPTPGFERVLTEHFDRIRAAFPDDIRVWDAHTHLGVDEDGFTLTPEELIDAMAAFGVDRCFTFPLNDPDRFPAYRVPNDRVLEWAAESDGALVPFCRLDLTEEPIPEAVRCLDRGARGIKLHPRAQRFTFGERALEPVFQLAAERRVPILIHAGRGLPAIADDLRHLVEHHPEAQLILAHAAIADLQHIGRTLLDHPNVLYDTSVWSNTDLRALLATASPEQIAFASDAPYGMCGIAQVQLGTVLVRAGAIARPAAGDHVGQRRAGRTRRAGADALAAAGLPRSHRPAPAGPRPRVPDHGDDASVDAPARHAGRHRPGPAGLRHRRHGELAAVEGLLDVAEEMWSRALAMEDRRRPPLQPRRRAARSRSPTRSSSTCDRRGDLLAAGEGRRFGGVKQLHPVDGVPMLERVLATVESAGIGERVVVLGARAGDVLAAIDLRGARAVVCETWRDGQAASLHAGLAALPEDAERALVVLGDGPGLDPRAVRRMADGAGGGACARRRLRRGALPSGDRSPHGLGRDPRSRRDACRPLGAALVDCRDLRPPGDVDYATSS